MKRVAAYNNNFHKFTSLVPEDADYSEISFEDVKYILQPDKNGVFTFNTYEFSRELFEYNDVFTYDSVLEDTNQSKEITTLKKELSNTKTSLTKIGNDIISYEIINKAKVPSTVIVSLMFTAK